MKPIVGPCTIQASEDKHRAECVCGFASPWHPFAWMAVQDAGVHIGECPRRFEYGLDGFEPEDEEIL